MLMLTCSSERIFNPTRYTGSKRSFSSSGEVQSFDSKVKTVIACTRCLLSFIRKYVMHKWQISVTMILKTLSFFNHLVHWIAYAIIFFKCEKISLDSKSFTYVAEFIIAVPFIMCVNSYFHYKGIFLLDCVYMSVKVI